MRYIFVVLYLSLLILWPLASATTAIDLTVIGHVKGWRALNYPKWLSGLIDENRFGADIVKDCKTHPQVIIKLAVDAVLFSAGVVLSVLFMVNEKLIEDWVIVIVDVIGGGVFASYLVGVRIAAVRAMRRKGGK